MKDGKLWAADHELLSGLKAIYEGVTISHLSESPKLHVVLRASNDLPLVSVSRDPKELVVYDCGFTRMYYKWEENVVSSTRWYQNVAAYLMGKKRRDLRGDVVSEQDPPRGNQTLQSSDIQNLSPQELIENIGSFKSQTQKKILSELSTRRGKASTLALVAVAEMEDTKLSKTAQMALARRMGRLKASSLKRYLQANSPQLRLAAARASQKNPSLDLADELVALITDPEKKISEAANKALQKMTNKDFGSVATATRLKKKSIQGKWQAWFDSN